MGKSIRSKWRRKMRNIKREKYSVREMDRLKRITGLTMQQDEEMKDLYEVKTSDKLFKGKKTGDENQMDVDKETRKINPKTLKDEHGSYPTWMNQRAIKRLKKTQGKGKKKKKGKKA